LFTSCLRLVLHVLRVLRVLRVPRVLRVLRVLWGGRVQTARGVLLRRRGPRDNVTPSDEQLSVLSAGCSATMVRGGGGVGARCLVPRWYVVCYRIACGWGSHRLASLVPDARRTLRRARFGLSQTARASLIDSVPPPPPPSPPPPQVRTPSTCLAVDPKVRPSPRSACPWTPRSGPQICPDHPLRGPQGEERRPTPFQAAPYPAPQLRRLARRHDQSMFRAYCTAGDVCAACAPCAARAARATCVAY
jgi:hypothetical protein